MEDIILVPEPAGPSNTMHFSKPLETITTDGKTTATQITTLPPFIVTINKLYKKLNKGPGLLAKGLIIILRKYAKYSI